MGSRHQVPEVWAPPRSPAPAPTPSHRHQGAAVPLAPLPHRLKSRLTKTVRRNTPFVCVKPLSVKMLHSRGAPSSTHSLCRDPTSEFFRGYQGLKTHESDRKKRACAHTHTHTHACKHAHTRTRTYTHVHTHTDTHVHMHADTTRAHTCTWTHARAHTRARMQTHTCTHARAHIHMRVHARTLTRAWNQADLG